MGGLSIAFERGDAPGEDPFDLEGDVLDGVFRVDKLVGDGELSLVYRGVHRLMHTPVAIKCLNLPRTLEPRVVEPIVASFTEGARAQARLARGNLHIVRTLSLGTTLIPRTGDQTPYLVREWLDGRSLADDLTTRARMKTLPRSAAQAVQLLDSAAGALAFAHAEGTCHHSVSPRNLFIAKTERGEVLKVLDFGWTRDAVSEPQCAGLRLLSSSAAPEQLDRRIGTPCAATDVFAFALVLFEVVTGRPYVPRDAHAAEVLRIAHSRRVAGVRVPSGLEEVFSRALAPTPGERHPNVGAFWDEVKASVARTAAAKSGARRMGVPTKPIVEKELVFDKKPTTLVFETKPAAAPPAKRPFPPLPSGGAKRRMPTLIGGLEPSVASTKSVSVASKKPVVEMARSSAPASISGARRRMPTLIGGLEPSVASTKTVEPKSVEQSPGEAVRPEADTLPMVFALQDFFAAEDPPNETTRLPPRPPPAVVAPALREAPVFPTPPARPSPISCTGEVVPPVTTSLASGSFPLSPAGDHRSAFDTNGFDVPPPPSAVQGPGTAVRKRSGIAVKARAAIGVLVAAAVPVLFALHEPAKEAAPQRNGRVFTNERAALVVPETQLRVAAAAPKPPTFDPAETTRRLDETAAELESCAYRIGPRGPGSINAVIHPSGKITRLHISPPYVGTATGRCVAKRFLDTELPPFAGSPRVLNYVFRTIPFVPSKSARAARH